MISLYADIYFNNFFKTKNKTKHRCATIATIAEHIQEQH